VKRARAAIPAVLVALGAGCGDRGAQPIPHRPGQVVASLPAYIYDLRSDGVRLWAELQDGSVWSLQPGVTDPAQVVPPQQTGTVFFPSPSLAVGSQEIYFNSPGGNISAVAKSGGAPRLLATAEDGPADLQTDGSTLWWAALSPLRIRSVAVSGGTPSDVAAIGGRPYAAAPDAVFFWLGAFGSSLQLMRLGTDGNPATQIDTAINFYPMIAAGRTLFYYKDAVIESRATAGGVAKDLANVSLDCHVGCTSPQLFAVGTNQLFVAATLDYPVSGDPTLIPVVYRVPVSGGTLEIIATPEGASPVALAAAADVPYWSVGNIIFTSQP
jgi:hypothetical protein